MKRHFTMYNWQSLNGFDLGNVRPTGGKLVGSGTNQLFSRVRPSVCQSFKLKMNSDWVPKAPNHN